MADEKKTFIQWADLAVKVTGLIGAAITVWLAFAQKQKDLNNKVYEKRLEVYSELCEIVAKIDSSESMEKAIPHVTRLNELIGGKLLLLEDGEVMNAAMEYSVVIYHQRGWKRFEPEKITDYGIKLCLACRRSLLKSFPTSNLGDANILEEINPRHLHMTIIPKGEDNKTPGKPILGPVLMPKKSDKDG